MNADVNGALNILRKVAGESAARRILSSGRVNRPVRIRLPAFGEQTPHEAPSVRAGSSLAFRFKIRALTHAS